MHRPARVPRLPGAVARRLLLCGWPTADARRQTASVNRSRSDQSSLQSETSASISSTPWRGPGTMSMDAWIRWPPALICDAPNLHHLGQIPCSIHPYCATSMLFLVHSFPNPNPYQSSPQYPAQRLWLIRSRPRCTGVPWVQWISLQQATSLSVSTIWNLVCSSGTLSGTSDLTPGQSTNSNRF